MQSCKIKDYQMAAERKDRLMLIPKHGIVKFFRAKSGGQYGFIWPDGADEAHDVFFHFNGGSVVHEEFLGELDLMNVGIREPKRGDRLVYYVADHTRGPAAFQWGYEKDWQKAEALIAARPWPECLLCRLVQDSKTAPYGKKILWEGYEPILWEGITNKKTPDLSRHPDWNAYIWFEERRVHGWERMFNPFDPSRRFMEGYVIPDEKREILARHEVARLAAK